MCMNGIFKYKREGGKRDRDTEEETETKTEREKKKRIGLILIASKYSHQKQEAHFLHRVIKYSLLKLMPPSEFCVLHINAILSWHVL